MLISNYEYDFKTMLRETSVNDEQYGKWVEKCNQKNLGTYEKLYQINAEGFLHFKNRIYVPNQYNVKRSYP